MRKIYGFVEGHRNISIIIDNFQCVFINSAVGINAFEEITSNQGFIMGRTVKGEYIYIYTGENLKVWDMLTLNTWVYFISNYENIDCFEAIVFRGGILNKLFYKSSFRLSAKDFQNMECTSDEKRYRLTKEEIKGELSVKSIINRSWSLEKGSSISNTDTVLQIAFDEVKNIESFSDIFGYILTLCQFITFRKNIKFEMVSLAKKSVRQSGIVETFADCYIQYDWEQDTEKPIVRCISFNMLGECVDKLLSAIIENKNGKPQIDLGFIPESDKDVYKITSVKIREVCSSLESEMELAKIYVKQEKEFIDLVNELKKIVKNHRDGDTSLVDAKVYDYILGDLNHLKGALADRIEKCFAEHEGEINESLTRSQIDQIVKYRNTITHGNYMLLDNSLADTAYIFIKLVYCCILKRIGLDEKIIKEIMNSGIIS